jgi:anti-sigma-K factor RskA
MKRILALAAVVVLTLAMTVAALADSGEKKATPSQTKFVMDGKDVAFDVAYNIEDSNYIQLRSVAQTLSGTKSQFNVYYVANHTAVNAHKKGGQRR